MHQANEKVPLIVHIIHKLQVGGLENGLVNLINNMPENRYRHAIVCMDTYTDFRNRIKRNDVECYALNKKPGQDPAVYFRLWKLLRQLKPSILHTRNIGTLECMLAGLIAGVEARVHGEHGRDMQDINGENKRYLLLRKLFRPLVKHYIALSKDLYHWLTSSVKVSADKITQIYNGVDTTKFSPDNQPEIESIDGMPFNDDCFVFGTVGRLQGEKDQLTLVRAFQALLNNRPAYCEFARLLIVGDGPLREELENYIKGNVLNDYVWLAGIREDIPSMLRRIDVFVLPSLGEGISNTILEAMACALPVIATKVGGNSELVEDTQTGLLVPPADTYAMSRAMRHYLENGELSVQHGTAGKQKVLEQFSMEAMVKRYLDVYDGLLAEQ